MSQEDNLLSDEEDADHCDQQNDAFRGYRTSFQNPEFLITQPQTIENQHREPFVNVLAMSKLENSQDIEEEEEQEPEEIFTHRQGMFQNPLKNDNSQIYLSTKMDDHKMDHSVSQIIKGISSSSSGQSQSA